MGVVEPVAADGEADRGGGGWRSCPEGEGGGFCAFEEEEHGGEDMAATT